MADPEKGTGAIFGIVNLTRDSFSDGGQYLQPALALAHARALFVAGAVAVDVGAASSHPDSQPVPPHQEIDRLSAVVPTLLAEGIPVSVDSHSPEVHRWAIGQGVQFLNDIHGFPNADVYPDLRGFPGRLVVMHSVQVSGPADRSHVAASEIMGRVSAFFRTRIAGLQAAGVARERLILDPGMGFFLGSEAESSLVVLRSLPDLKREFGLPLLVSVSRKSFVGALTGRPVAERSAGTLAAELYAIEQGADYIRTHDVAALRDALATWRALKLPRSPGTKTS